MRSVIFLPIATLNVYTWLGFGHIVKPIRRNVTNVAKHLFAWIRQVATEVLRSRRPNLRVTH
jgi:hypothetical protein